MAESYRRRRPLPPIPVPDALSARSSTLSTPSVRSPSTRNTDTSFTARMKAKEVERAALQRDAEANMYSEFGRAPEPIAVFFDSVPPPAYEYDSRTRHGAHGAHGSGAQNNALELLHPTPHPVGMGRAGTLPMIVPGRNASSASSLCSHSGLSARDRPSSRSTVSSMGSMRSSDSMRSMGSMGSVRTPNSGTHGGVRVQVHLRDGAIQSVSGLGGFKDVSEITPCEAGHDTRLSTGQLAGTIVLLPWSAIYHVCKKKRACKRCGQRVPKRSMSPFQ